MAMTDKDIAEQLKLSERFRHETSWTASTSDYLEKMFSNYPAALRDLQAARAEIAANKELFKCHCSRCDPNGVDASWEKLEAEEAEKEKS